ncbi:hypothetical protein ACUKBL_12060 [Furfurilactobacillus rossiae]
MLSTVKRIVELGGNMTEKKQDLELMQGYIEEYLFVGKYLNEFASRNQRVILECRLING